MPPDAPVSACDTDFSGMGIYIDGRVKNELDELLGTKPASDLTARDVHLIASMHYLDDQPMLRAAEFFGLTAKEDADAGGASKPSADATASPNATAFAATTCINGPPWRPGKMAELNFLPRSSSRERIMPPRGPRSVLCVVVVTTSAYGTGLGYSPAATSTAKWAISTIR